MTPPIRIDDFDERLKQVLSDGFRNADAMFASIVNRMVSHERYYFGLHSMAEMDSEKLELSINEEHTHLITTRIFGDTNGKSYLLLSEDEKNEIIRLTGLEKASTEMKIGFLKELANILSAAVITVISNEYKMKVYGDVPQLHPIGPIEMDDMIRQDFCNVHHLYIVSAFLKAELQPGFKLIFVWAIVKDGLKEKVFSPVQQFMKMSSAQ
jgi:chemotaxis protein CheY-P-specific phosphatase CheC